MLIGILNPDNAVDPHKVEAAEYIADGPANEWPAPVELVEFFDDNGDAFDGCERAAIESLLRSSGRYISGGGAEGLFVLINLGE